MKDKDIVKNFTLEFVVITTKAKTTIEADNSAGIRIEGRLEANELRIGICGVGFNLNSIEKSNKSVLPAHAFISVKAGDSTAVYTQQVNIETTTWMDHFIMGVMPKEAGRE